jgi:CRISPR system Cascade subunit CasC
MKLIELHILQSFPVSCLNRDDVGAPKTAIFGGVTRARISSQCLKRAIRQQAKEFEPGLFRGERSRLIVDPIAEAAIKSGAPEAAAREAAKKLCNELAVFDEKALKDKGVRKVKTLMFLSPLEREEIGRELARLIGEAPDAKALDKKIKSAAAKVGDAKLKDAADIAIFGRMVATDHSLTVEGAGMFSHALSTHKAENDIDFFTAVDDLQDDDASVEGADRAGSGMMGILEFTSAVYYRFVGLNLDLLSDKDHLGALPVEDRRNALDAFLRACVLAVPSARQNSMNAHTVPGYVLGLVREKGHPLQLVNAFEKPVTSSRNGWMEPSIAALKAHHDQLNKTWGIKPAYSVVVPDQPFADFLKELLAHV